MIVSAAIWANASREPGRIQTEDIVSVRPQGWDWGTKVVLPDYIVKEIDLGSKVTTIEQAIEMFSQEEAGLKKKFRFDLASVGGGIVSGESLVRDKKDANWRLSKAGS